MSKTMLMLLFAGFVLTGCNTVEGVGKDIRHAGGSLEENAQEHKPAERQPVRTRTVVYR
ncbi:entericidin A/B family lipoprotein [Candidatus Odyssella acanthamoebae]|uniref:entericidin A/B family lipoprotein n=1 Tax=Candidatus Odyssella acanthamoebae TaxID=91604 RepID=UPI00056EF0AC|nr:entericidin A/B family lipoprotein [Candidatus Paracaedibacter acanthamoebae]